MPIEQIALPFYADWKFWSFMASVVAIGLSQLPPIHIWLRSARLTVEAYSQMFLTHKFGNPNSQLHLIVQNNGGRKVRVTAITLRFFPTTAQPFAIPAATYFQKQGDAETVLFTPFSLLPGEEWAHIVFFYPSLSRADDKLIRDSKAVLRRDINAKREALEDKNQGVPADEASVAPFLELLNRQFKWLPDEYEMAVCVTTEPADAVPDQRFRFVLFESDANTMRNVADEYKFGGGILFDAHNNEGTFVPLQKIKAK
jgi:hypothetical protein